MKYGYRDVTDVNFIDLSTGNPVIFMDYLQTASQAYGSEIVYARGARGAAKLVGFQSDNNVKLELTAGLITPEMLSIMFGTAIEKGVQKVPVTKVIETNTNSFDLKETPVIGIDTPLTIAFTIDGTVPEVQLKKVTGVPDTDEFSMTGTVVTVDDITYPTGGKFLVSYYIETSDKNKRVSFKSDKFTKAFKMTGYTLFKNTEDEKLYPCRITIPKIQLEVNGATLNSAMNGDPTAFKFAGECLKTNNGTDLIIYDIDEGTPID